jgi:uncharacterized cupredoxin-like copper-binding protein
MASTACKGLTTLVMVLLLIACSPSADRRNVPPGTDRVVELSMEGMHFIPDRIEVKAGELVAFVVTNPNDVAHEVFIGSEADQMAHHAVHMAVASPGQAQIPHGGYGIFLAPHETGVLSYRFDTPGEIMLGCHLPGHWEAGMKAVVIVEP